MLSICLTVLLAGAAPSAEPAWTGQLERAVAVGSLPSLQAMRIQLLQDMESAGVPDGGQRYLLAYLNWRIQQNLDPEKDRKQRDRLLKEAQKGLKKLLKTDPGNAEALALRGSVLGERIHGFFRGMFLGPKASKSLRRAAEIAPENPRVALQRGIGWYFTPKAFGGGMEAAEAKLRRALELFRHEDESAPWPNWGRVDAFAWLGRLLAEKGEVSQARDLYEQALAIDPEHAWIRDELLPALDARP